MKIEKVILNEKGEAVIKGQPGAKCYVVQPSSRGELFDTLSVPAKIAKGETRQTLSIQEFVKPEEPVAPPAPAVTEQAAPKAPVEKPSSKPAETK